MTEGKTASLMSYRLTLKNCCQAQGINMVQRKRIVEVSGGRVEVAQNARLGTRDRLVGLTVLQRESELREVALHCVDGD